MSTSPTAHLRSRKAWAVLIAVLGIETLAGVVALIPLALGFLDAGEDLLGQRVSVLLAGLLSVLWVAVTFLGALRSRASWARGSALTLHVLMFAAGTAMLQYALAPGWAAWGAILLAFAGFFSALLARPEYVEPGDAEGADADEAGSGAPVS